MKIEPTAVHQACMDDFKAALQKNAAKLSGVEILALASQLVGMVIALQDQRTMTREAIMEIVAGNIEIGNATAIETIFKDLDPTRKN